MTLCSGGSNCCFSVTLSEKQQLDLPEHNVMFSSWKGKCSFVVRLLSCYRQACTNRRCTKQPVNGFQIWHTLQACHCALQIARVVALNWPAFAVNGTSCSSTCGVVATCQSLTASTLQNCPELSSGLSSMLASAEHISMRASVQDMQPYIGVLAGATL